MAWRKPNNLREWLRIIFQHKKKFFFPAVLTMVAVFVGSHWMPRSYRAEARFMRRNDPALVQMRSVSASNHLAHFRRSLSEDVRGRAAVSQLVEDLGLDRDLPRTSDGQLTAEGQQRKTDLVNQMRRRFSIGYQMRSDAQDQVVVAFTSEDRELPPRMVNQAVENYLRQTRMRLDEELGRTKSFFEKQVKTYSDRIADLEKRKLEFQMRHPGLTPDSPANVQNQKNTMEERLRQVIRELQTARAQRVRHEEYVQNQPPEVEERQIGANPALVDLRQQRAQMDRQMESHLLLGRKPEHPDVLKLQRRLDDVDRRIAATPPEVELGAVRKPNASRQEAERAINTLAGTIEALEREQEGLTRRVEHYGMLDRQFYELRSDYIRYQRELSEAQGQFGFWSNHLRQVTLAWTAEISAQGVRLSVSDLAQDIQRPSKPALFNILSMAMAAGLGVGCGMILLAELLDHSLRNVEHAVDELRLPVLGSVNEIVTPGQMVRRKILNTGVFPALAALCVAALLASFYLAKLSLEKPIEYERLKVAPRQMFSVALR